LRRWAGPLLALVALSLVAAPAGAATRAQVQSAAFAVPAPAVPARDAVIKRPTRALARSTASASAARWDVHDGAGRSVDISVSLACSITCTDANEQAIADFLGTLAHGDEMIQLSVQLVTPGEIAGICGPGAQACYFPSLNRMLINGNDTTASDGATRAFVIAHEYGHHVANHRDNSPFDNPAIDWGPKNWTSYKSVCPGVRSGIYYPGDEVQDSEGGHYFENPGEAFAESFAFNRFPGDQAVVPWHWIASLKPDAGAFAAIQRDALSPWAGPSTDPRQGRFPRKRRPRVKVKHFATPRDGNMSIKLSGPDRANLDLRVFAGNRLIADSDGPGSQEQMSSLICGERSLTAVVRRHGKRRTGFRLAAVLP
jgi:hypothetical protein